MTPAFSMIRTRRRQGDADSPTFSARSATLTRPSSCRTPRILRSISSSAAVGIIRLRIGHYWQDTPKLPCFPAHIGTSRRAGRRIIPVPSHLGRAMADTAEILRELEKKVLWLAQNFGG